MHFTLVEVRVLAAMEREVPVQNHVVVVSWTVTWTCLLQEWTYWTKEARAYHRSRQTVIEHLRSRSYAENC